MRKVVQQEFALTHAGAVRFMKRRCTGERLVLLEMAIGGESGWVDLVEPIIVRAEAFVAVPEQEGKRA